jgi:geranylgeranyl pyrophosphate synthase
MQIILELASKSKSRDWILPVQIPKAVSGSLEAAMTAAASLVCCQINIILVDDMLDHDPRGEHCKVGHDSAANLATGFQAAALQALSLSTLPASDKLEAIYKINNMLFQTAHGQALDVEYPKTEEAYWAILQKTSAPFYGVSFAVAALYGGAALHTVSTLEKLGEQFGIMIQIHDDLHDTMEAEINSDWLEGRLGLPLLYAELNEFPEKRRFMQLKAKVAEDQKALEEAQNILIRSGAVSYCIHAITSLYEDAMKDVSEIKLAKPEKLNDVMNDVIEPVNELFERLGIEPPKAL